MIEIIAFLVPVFASFFVTLLIIPVWIKRARNCNLVGKDVHKIDKRKVSEAGGVTVLAGFLFGTLIFVAISTFFFNSTMNFIEIMATLVVMLSVALIGLIDDILGWKVGLSKKLRMVLVAFASIPLIAINAGRSIVALPFIGPTDIGLVYPLLLIPIGIVGASTTFNFLAGYNGQEAGQGILILSALAIVAYFTGSLWLSVIALVMIFSLLAFLIFNFYPSRILPGDSLTYMVGALIAVMAILGNFERIATFFFIPYILEIFLKARGKLEKESFANVKKDGSLELRYKKIYSLNHLMILVLKKAKIKTTEKRVVYSMWVFQLIFILLGFLIFKGGIF